MFAKRKFFLLVAAVAAVMSLGAFAAYGQGTTTPAQPPFAGMGQRGMAIGAHLMWDGDSAPMFTAFAQALGIDEQTLISELQSGKTLAQLAQEKGVDLAAVTQAAQTTMKQHLDALVTAGVLTQAQADARLSLVQEHWTDMPLLNGTGTGYGMMMGSMGRGGMWNNGDTMPRGGMWNNGDTMPRGGMWNNGDTMPRGNMGRGG